MVPCRLPANASATKKQIAAFLKQRLKMPDVSLIILFSVKPWAWTLLAAWLIGAPLASRLQVRTDVRSTLSEPDGGYFGWVYAQTEFQVC